MCIRDRPRRSCQALDEVFRANAASLVGEHMIDTGSHGAGSSDIGDIMHILPAIHPSCGGAKGAGHSEEYVVDDPETAYVLPANLLALTAIDLLWNDAARGRRIVDEFQPLMTKQEYLDMWERTLADRA